MKPLIFNIDKEINLKGALKAKEALEQISISPFFVCCPLCFLALMHSKKYELCSPYVSQFKEKNSLSYVSTPSLKSLDVKAVMVDSDKTMEEKTALGNLILKQSMQCIFVLSDTQSDYDYQYSFQKLLAQIRAILSHIPKRYYSSLIFLYEPNWTKDVLDLAYLENLFYLLKTELHRDYDFFFPIWYSAHFSKNQIVPYFNSAYLDGISLHCNEKQISEFSF